MEELEEHMAKVVGEKEKEVTQLNSRVWQLESDVQRCNRLVLSWNTRCQSLEIELLKERQIRENVEREVAAIRRMNSEGEDVVPLPPRRRPNPVQGSLITPRDTGEQITPIEQDEPAFSCGKCRLDTRCECMEHALEMMGEGDEDPDKSLKRPHTPTSHEEDKRCRLGADETGTENGGMEIDFTSHAAFKRPPAISTSISSTSLSATAPPDPCGFCRDGTACICADLEKEDHKGSRGMESISKPPIVSVGASQNPCINGPGTCAQCRSDAKSTLFCKSLAATRSNRSVQADPNVDSKCIKKPSPNIDNSNNTAITGVSLSCADTYTTLSRHPAYERASEDPGSWMPKLSTVPTDTSMTAFEIEAASILHTLRFFDKSYGAGK